MLNIQQITFRQIFAAALLNIPKQALFFLARVPALLFDLPMCSFVRKISENERQEILNQLEVGDILLTTDKLFPLWELLVSLLGSPNYSHSAIYEGDSTVVEATTSHLSGKGVARTAAQSFLSGRKTVCVIRPPYRSNDDKNAVLFWIRQQIGKPFDFCFNRNDESTMYCSKLVAKAMSVAGLTVNIRKNFGREGYAPDAFLQMEDANIVYRKKESTIEKTMTYFSLALSVFILLAGLAPWWAVCLVLFGVGGLQLLMKI